MEIKKAQNLNFDKPRLDAVFGNSEEEILKIQSKSVDIICIDPPYLYLKGQKLEREFDERLFFSECMRILKPGGFVILFGRGISFYRWNLLLDEFGFSFKEEIIWNKEQGTSPLSKLNRVHETVSIFCKGNASINKIKVPFLEIKNHDIAKIRDGVDRILSSLGNPDSLKYLKDFLEGKRSDMSLNTRFTKHKVTTDIRKSGKREVNQLSSMVNGQNEKSIITVNREHYNSIHPTQKPVRLLERLLQLCLPNKPKEEILVVDFFAGSFSCGEACYNLGVNFKGYEIDKEYFDLGNERLRKVKFQTKFF